MPLGRIIHSADGFCARNFCSEVYQKQWLLNCQVRPGPCCGQRAQKPFRWSQTAGTGYVSDAISCSRARHTKVESRLNFRHRRRPHLLLRAGKRPPDLPVTDDDCLENEVLPENRTGAELQCLPTGLGNVECVIPGTSKSLSQSHEALAADSIPSDRVVSVASNGHWASASEKDRAVAAGNGAGAAATDGAGRLDAVLDTLLLISPFFFWGTAMVAMKGVLPKAGPLFVSTVRLLPAGAMLISFASWRGRPMPSGAMAWFAVALFGLVDGAMFQGFLAEGLRRTSAGLGSVIIDSQPLTVALLAAALFGESIGPLGVVGLAIGVVGLCLLEVPEDLFLSFFTLPTGTYASSASLDAFKAFTAEGGLWESGEFWMLLAAQSMAVGTVMVRWVCKYTDPIMATGWHMVLGGLPLLALSLSRGEPAVTGHITELGALDWTSLFYTSLFGSAVSYGVFFYNANKGNLTRLSSLTFLTPMFAAFFGYLFLDETLSPIQLFGAATTLVGIYLVNYKAEDAK